MKKLFIIPAMLLCISGVSSNKVKAPERQVQLITAPISTKIDSLNIKAAELNILIREQ
jgi:hypothetical protein